MYFVVLIVNVLYWTYQQINNLGWGVLSACHLQFPAYLPVLAQFSLMGVICFKDYLPMYYQEALRHTTYIIYRYNETNG